GHQDEQQAASWKFAGKRCDQRGTHNHAEGVDGDDVSGLVFGDLKVGGDRAEQTHGDKFRHTDGEATECEGSHDDISTNLGNFRLPRNRAAFDMSADMPTASLWCLRVDNLDRIFSRFVHVSTISDS